MWDGEKVRCCCKYKCSRLEKKYAMVRSRTKRAHEVHDRKGELCSEKYLNDHVASKISPHVGEGSQSSIRDVHSELDLSVGRRQHEWRASMNVSLGMNVRLSPPRYPIEHMDIQDDMNLPPHMQYGLHILPEMTLDLAKALHQQTWAFQAKLDKHKVPQDVQDDILKSLFGKVQSSKQNGDMSGLGLGALLQHACVNWDGGPNGMKALSSFRSLCSTFEEYGMPRTQRWRMCIGSKDCWHRPIVLPPSKQDNYNVRTGVKCDCAHRSRKWTLARDCTECSERCPWESCNKTRKDMLRFEYFPIGPLLRKLCKSRSVCHEILEMWRKRAQWFRKGPGERPKYEEWWDGEGAAELSFFWDKDKEFELPVVCPVCFECYATLPTKCAELLDKSNWDATAMQYDLQCSQCGSRLRAPRRIAKGDPRNIALMAHWDGFQSSTCAQNSTWTVEVQILNAGSRTKIPPILVLFIPACGDDEFLKKYLNCLDAFLEPFIREFESLFVNGIEVEYNYPEELLRDSVATSTNQFVMRAILAIFTGDNPAQCKFSGWSTSGYSACRNCEMSSRWIPNGSPIARSGNTEDCEPRNVGLKGKMVYHSNRREMRYPPHRRTMDETLQWADNLARATSKAERTEMMRETGITCKTRVWRLHHLYGFCLIKDLVYDTMHILALCLFKKYSEMLIASVKIEKKQNMFRQALAEVTARRPKGFDGRWPKKPLDRLGYFKGEEYTRFVLYCVPHILQQHEIDLDSRLGMLGILLTEIARLFYIKSRDEGWTRENLKRARTLLASWRVRSEDAGGHVAGSGEILDGIERHGPHYIYWCYRFERMVGDYGRIHTNSKDMEVTYAQYYARRFFTMVSTFIWEDDNGLFPQQRALAKFHKSLRVTIEHRGA